jgi:uncharacterized membrane protein YfcA
MTIMNIKSTLFFITLFLSLFLSVYLIIRFTSNSASYKKALLTIFGTSISSLFILFLLSFVPPTYLIYLFGFSVILFLVYRFLLGRNSSSSNVSLSSSVASSASSLSSLFHSLMSTDYKELLWNAGLLVVGGFLAYQLWNQITMSPSLESLLLAQGGKILVNKPVYLEEEHILANYRELNGIEDRFKYNYAISFWVFLDSNPTNTAKYSSLLNYGNKPNIQYNPEKNTIQITMDTGFKVEYSSSSPVLNQNTVSYTIEKVPLQKWNNIIINYQAGILDIFFNGELVKSMKRVIPYMSMDTLTIGETAGAKGGIGNVIYFEKPLTLSNIYYLYKITDKKMIPDNRSSSGTTIVKMSAESK